MGLVTRDTSIIVLDNLDSMTVGCDAKRFEEIAALPEQRLQEGARTVICLKIKRLNYRDINSLAGHFSITAPLYLCAQSAPITFSIHSGVCVR